MVNAMQSGDELLSESECRSIGSDEQQLVSCYTDGLSTDDFSQCVSRAQHVSTLPYNFTV